MVAEAAYLGRIPWRRVANLKLRALWAVLEEQPRTCEYVIWLDSDILVNRPELPVERWIRRHPGAYLLAADDDSWQPPHPTDVNTGVLFLRSASPLARSLVREALLGTIIECALDDSQDQVRLRSFPFPHALACFGYISLNQPGVQP